MIPETALTAPQTLADVRAAIHRSTLTASQAWRDRVTEVLVATWIELVECADDAGYSFGAARALETVSEVLDIDLPAAVREAEETASYDPEEGEEA